MARETIYSAIVDAELVVPQTSKEVLYLTIDEFKDSLDSDAKQMLNEAVALSALNLIMIITTLLINYRTMYVFIIIVLCIRVVECLNKVAESYTYKLSATELQGEYNGPPFTPTTSVYWY